MNEQSTTAATVFLFLAACVPLQVASAETLQEDKVKAGKGSFVFANSEGDVSKPITVWYYQPEQVSDEAPILFVMHGVKRNAERYRDSWIKHAKLYGFVLFVPEFSSVQFKGSRRYNLGNMFASKGKRNKKSQWSFSVIEHMFDHIKSLTGNASDTYFIYGHSAGGQFVHRMVMFRPDARIQQAVAANSGWYTLPTFKEKFPYGLKKSGGTRSQLKSAFQKNLLVLLGEEDIDENHKHLRKTPEAMRQGKHRLERGHTFFQTAQSEAEELHVPFNWTLKIVAGVAHSNPGMARAAAQELFGEMGHHNLESKPQPSRD